MVIDLVCCVMYIVLVDENYEIIGLFVVVEGVIFYLMREFGLCGGMIDCIYSIIIEVYLDSFKVIV